MVFSGVWDNDDAVTENFHAIFKEMAPGPNPSEASQLRKAFLSLLEKHNDVYCDYGNCDIDDMFKEHKLPYKSSIHCPQKAGTRIFEVNGEWVVEAKSGYGKPFERI